MGPTIPSDGSTRLEAAIPEVRRRAASGAALSAVVLLGEVFAASAPETRSDALRDVRAQVSEDVLLRARAEAVQAVDRALHILSIGSTFDSHEIILVLTTRFEVELASPILNETVDFRRLDDELRVLARSRENRKAFSTALRTIRRNWSVPIDDRWSP